jgi:hypothetical protein
MTTDPLVRIAEALERLSPPPAAPLVVAPGASHVWRSAEGLRIVADPVRQPLDALVGYETQKAAVTENLARFKAGLPFNHVLLWGARGTGKSALAKAAAADAGVALIEVPRDELVHLGRLAAGLAGTTTPAAVFLDDLSFDAGDGGYKGLKSLLDGGVGAEFARVLVLATSNRRHLLARDAEPDDLRPDELADEQLALADRFGLWLGFHLMDQPTYLAAVRGYAARHGLEPDDPGLERAALQWAARRGSRSGRTAWQFIQDRAGRLGVSFTSRS